MAVLVEKLVVMMVLMVMVLMATVLGGDGGGVGDCGCFGDELTPLPQLRDLHLERGLLWPREAGKPIEAPSVK